MYVEEDAAAEVEEANDDGTTFRNTIANAMWVQYLAYLVANNNNNDN